jgi:hypothetical protein
MQVQGILPQVYFDKIILKGVQVLTGIYVVVLATSQQHAHTARFFLCTFFSKVLISD